MAATVLLGQSGVSVHGKTNRMQTSVLPSGLPWKCVKLWSLKYMEAEGPMQVQLVAASGDDVVFEFHYAHMWNRTIQ